MARFNRRPTAGTLTALGLIVAALVAGTDAVAQSAQPAPQVQGKDVMGRSFAKKDLKNEDFRGQDLKGADFTFANLRNATFAGADLRGAIFRNAQLEGADLTGADLRGADLAAAHFVSAKLTRANLEGQNLYLAGADIHFENYDKIAKDWTIREAFKPDLNNGTLTLQAANLRNAKIFGSVKNVDFRRTDLRGADFTKATDQSDGIFRGASYDTRTRWNVDVANAGAVKGEDAPLPATWFVGIWGIEKDRPGEQPAAKTGRLKISEDGTYEWNAGDDKPLTGKWEAVTEGSKPQIKLQRGELGLDWIAKPEKEDLILKSGDGKRTRIAFRA